MNYIYKLKFLSESITTSHTDEEGNEQIITYVKDAKQVAEEALRSVADKSMIETVVEIGVITKPAIIEDGEVVKEAEVVDGWHVDLLAHEYIPELVPYCLDHMPEQPVHGDGWAGSDYIFVTKI